VVFQQFGFKKTKKKTTSLLLNYFFFKKTKMDSINGLGGLSSKKRKRIHCERKNKVYVRHYCRKKPVQEIIIKKKLKVPREQSEYFMRNWRKHLAYSPDVKEAPSLNYTKMLLNAAPTSFLSPLSFPEGIDYPERIPTPQYPALPKQRRKLIKASEMPSLSNSLNTSSFYITPTFSSPQIPSLSSSLALPERIYLPGKNLPTRKMHFLGKRHAIEDRIEEQRKRKEARKLKKLEQDLAFKPGFAPGSKHSYAIADVRKLRDDEQSYIPPIYRF